MNDTTIPFSKLADTSPEQIYKLMIGDMFVRVVYEL